MVGNVTGGLLHFHLISSQVLGDKKREKNQKRKKLKKMNQKLKKLIMKKKKIRRIPEDTL